jgi:hypothetical protein
MAANRRGTAQHWMDCAFSHSPAQIYSTGVEWARNDGYVVTDDRGRLDLPLIHRWLSEESYWAEGRTIDVVTKSIERSVSL